MAMIDLGLSRLWEKRLEAGVTFVIAIVLALVAYRLTMLALRRFVDRTPSRADNVVVERIAAPMRWIFLAVALSMAARGVDLKPHTAALWQQIAGFVVPALVGWMVIATIRAVNDVVDLRYDVTVADNLKARRKRTRYTILTRIAVICVVFITLCMMLLSIPAIRTVGVTLMASAGLAGLAVGAAAQPALKNLIAGIQLAFTEPIRLDDVVIIEGEWGRIEEIRLTYVVVRIWDDRRLVVPVSKFLEDSFQNWTRSNAQLLGSVFVYVDPAADVARLRARAELIVRDNPRWDKRFWNLQVTDATPDAIQLRVLATAQDASIAFDLRCDVREGLMRYIATEMPEAIVRRRLVAEGFAHANDATPTGGVPR
ncbi:mechanosensitive ion channel family protein [Sphingomonas sp. PAMC 26621]|uniref:mechanosensitive ion channel family protein n=1 Tax=Sphingomonas sp. PAMC 26621 TaxID=1112213 RepID=UPI00028821CF|nr:mechanosensitive ion channel domain-containing protein [Sphingomonas sp. PAMC 26621]